MADAIVPIVVANVIGVAVIGGLFVSSRRQARSNDVDSYNDNVSYSPPNLGRRPNSQAVKTPRSETAVAEKGRVKSNDDEYYKLDRILLAGGIDKRVIMDKYITPYVKLENRTEEFDTVRILREKVDIESPDRPQTWYTNVQVDEAFRWILDTYVLPESGKDGEITLGGNPPLLVEDDAEEDDLEDEEEYDEEEYDEDSSHLDPNVLIGACQEVSKDPSIYPAFVHCLVYSHAVAYHLKDLKINESWDPNALDVLVDDAINKKTYFFLTYPALHRIINLASPKRLIQSLMTILETKEKWQISPDAKNSILTQVVDIEKKFADKKSKVALLDFDIIFYSFVGILKMIVRSKAHSPLLNPSSSSGDAPAPAPAADSPLPPSGNVTLNSTDEEIKEEEAKQKEGKDYILKNTTAPEDITVGNVEDLLYENMSDDQIEDILNGIGDATITNFETLYTRFRKTKIPDELGSILPKLNNITEAYLKLFDDTDNLSGSKNTRILDTPNAPDMFKNLMEITIEEHETIKSEKESITPSLTKADDGKYHFEHILAYIPRWLKVE